MVKKIISNRPEEHEFKFYIENNELLSNLKNVDYVFKQTDIYKRVSRATLLWDVFSNSDLKLDDIECELNGESFLLNIPYLKKYGTIDLIELNESNVTFEVNVKQGMFWIVITSKEENSPRKRNTLNLPNGQKEQKKI